MDPLSREYINAFYDKNLLIHGDRPEALRWTRAGQEARYSLMTEVAPSLEGRRILDYGCGRGDFYSFLKERGIDVTYFGVDINPRLVELASGRHPECSFRVLDVEEEEIPGDFLPIDYAFICGVFNNRVEGATESMKNAMAKLFPLVGHALAVNAVSAYARQDDIEINYVRPEDILSFALGYLTPYVTLRHDRMREDFTMFLYKSPTKHAP